MENSILYYVYIIESLKDASRYYTGFSVDLDARLSAHNQSKFYGVFHIALDSKLGPANFCKFPTN
jgi:predicted GIY-YIG superfamily endonuclease